MKTTALSLHTFICSFTERGKVGNKNKVKQNPLGISFYHSKQEKTFSWYPFLPSLPCNFQTKEERHSECIQSHPFCLVKIGKRHIHQISHSPCQNAQTKWPVKNRIIRADFLSASCKTCFHGTFDPVNVIMCMLNFPISNE